MLYGSEQHRARLLALLEDGSDFLAGLAEEWSDAALIPRCLVLDAVASAEGKPTLPPDAAAYSREELRGLFPVSTN